MLSVSPSRWGGEAGQPIIGVGKVGVTGVGGWGNFWVAATVCSTIGVGL